MFETAEIVALFIAAALIVAGLAAVVWRDMRARQEQIGAVRRVFEVLLPAAGAVILLGAVLAWAG